MLMHIKWDAVLYDFVMLNSDLNVQECDATKHHSSNAVGFIKIICIE